MAFDHLNSFCPFTKPVFKFLNHSSREIWPERELELATAKTNDMFISSREAPSTERIGKTKKGLVDIECLP